MDSESESMWQESVIWVTFLHSPGAMEQALGSRMRKVPKSVKMTADIIFLLHLKSKVIFKLL
jgi:hypothetical protein